MLPESSSNQQGSHTLYKDILGYEIHDIEKEYYADKENAYDMQCDLRPKY